MIVMCSWVTKGTCVRRVVEREYIWSMNTTKIRETLRMRID